jgi:hypothetical protein
MAACAALFLFGCGSSTQSLIIGKWQAESAIKLTAEFHKDGTANLTMFGQTMRGKYSLTPPDELEWTLNGRTTKAKVKVTAEELELTNAENQTIVYKRK